VNEGEDGVDTLRWITAQPWCNGKVGTYGLSYCAHVQVMTSGWGGPVGRGQ
jgi:predicted acyl esterase